MRAVGGAHGEAGIDAGEQRSRERKPAVGEGHVRVVDDPIDRVGRRTAGDRVMDRGSQAVDIRPRSLRGGRELLDRGVARGEDRRHRLRASGYCGAGGAEIDQHGVTVAIDQDIGGLDIAMQEAHLVDLLEPVQKGRENPVEACGVERPLSLDLLEQGTAAHELHDEIGRAVGLEKVVHLHDTRQAMKRRQRAPLGDEAVASPGEVGSRIAGPRRHGRAVLPDGERGRQIFLDRHLASELAIDGTVGDAETALPQNGDDTVPPHELVRPQ